MPYYPSISKLGREARIAFALHPNNEVPGLYAIDGAVDVTGWLGAAIFNGLGERVEAV